MADLEVMRQIIESVGGESNVVTLGHCMTRLRFTLKNDSLANDEAVKKIKGVKGLSRSAGQYQLIIGTGTVDDYFDTIMANYKFEAGVGADAETQGSEKGGNSVLNLISNGMGILAGSIAPWLGCIMGSLMISAILSLLVSLRILNTESSTYQFFSLISGACVYTLPILVGFSAAEKLQTNKYMGALLGAILIYPNLMNAISEGTVSIFGLSIRNFSYASTVLPVLLAVWLLKYVEKFAKKICPKVIYIHGLEEVRQGTVLCLTHREPLSFSIISNVLEWSLSGYGSFLWELFSV